MYYITHINGQDGTQRKTLTNNNTNLLEFLVISILNTVWKIV